MSWLIVAVLPLAYLLGTFPSAPLVARAHGVDVMAEGSGNPGASNIIRLLGWRAGALVLGIDMAKGAIASGAGLALAGRPGAYVLGAAAVLGHTFPLWRKGGKGIATAGGMLIVLHPVIAPALGLVWFAIVKLVHKASLASLVICVAFPILAALTGREVWEVAVLSVMALLLIARHAANIGRLLRREENDLVAGARPPRAP